MDLGEPFKHQMRIVPGDNGSFVVFIDDHADPRINGRLVGFTTIDDLLIWMARHGVKARVTGLQEGDVVRTAREADIQEHALAIGREGAACGMDALRSLKRTSAAEIIREREARNTGSLAARVEAMQAGIPTSNDAA